MRKPRARGAWIITGAASGFGREFAIRLARRGTRVVLWDMNEKGLEETRRLAFEAPIDVVNVADQAAVDRAAERARASSGPIAHVVHCAGILRVGPAASVSAADYRAMMEVNYLGSVHLARTFLDDLSRAGAAGAPSTLLFVASVAGLRGFPDLAGYSASKFAVIGFAQALRDELAGTHVQVRVVCPPPGDTPMVRNLEKVPAVYKLSRLYTAEEVVAATIDGLDRSGFLIFVDAKSRAMYAANRAAPAIVDRIVRGARKD
jgi:NAD(P)-dependent dehydrogenase (short-subunit alcohol dehydrogenase family)